MTKLVQPGAQSRFSARSTIRVAAQDVEWWYRLGLLGVLLLGWALRLVFWWQQSRTGVVPPVSDEEEYYRGAIHILKSFSYYDQGQWLRAPLPSIILALCFLLSGGIDVARALAIQALISGLAVLPIAATARSYYASRRVGLGAGLLSALYVPYAISAGQLMSEPSAILLIALTMWCFERWRVTDRCRWLFWAGVALSSFTLARAVGLYAQVLVLAWIGWRYRERRAVVQAAGVFLVGFWLVLAPWSIRNTLVFGRVVLVDTNAGFSFWSGTDDPDDRGQLQVLWNATIANPAERQARFMARALENIQRDPLAWVLAGRSKVVAFWQPRSRVLIANGLYSLVPALNSVPLTLLGDLLYVLIALGTIGSVLYAWRSRPHWLLIVWPLYGTALSAASLGHPRLRIPFEVSLLILGSYAVAHPTSIWRRFRAGSARRSFTLVAAALAFSLLIWSSAYGPFLRSQVDLLTAAGWWRAGNVERSLRATEAAVSADPDNVLPLLALAERQQAMGDARRIATWEAVLQLDPNVLPARVELLRAALQAEDAEAIRRWFETLQTLRRDDNRLYAWLWAQNPRQPRHDLQIGGTGDLGLIQGVGAGQQADGVQFRWTQSRADVRMPAGGATTLNVQVRGWRENTQVQLSADGRLLGACRVGEAWSMCSVALDASAAPRVITLRSPVDVPWPPTDYLPRGVALARVSLDP